MTRSRDLSGGGVLQGRWYRRPRPAALRLLRGLLAVLAVLAVAACQPPGLRPATPAAPPASPALPGVPGWIPLHGDPRRGDHVLHRQITATGLTDVRRRTEVIRVGKDGVEVRRTQTGQEPVHLYVASDGAVLHAWHAARPGQRLQPGPAERRQTRLRRTEDLALVSGTFPVTHVVTRRASATASRPLTGVFYLSPRVPFREVVSLTTAEPLSAQQLQKLLGRIAVPTPQAGRSDAAGYRAPIDSGWVLIEWGRGAP